MNQRLSKLFHAHAKRLLRNHGVPEDLLRWPVAWSTVFYKSYARLPQIKLPETTGPRTLLTEALSERYSEQDFANLKAPSLEEFSTLLRHAAGIRSKHTSNSIEHAQRTYPSGGARYPLEVYVATKGSETMETGLYHYHVPTHSLEQLGGADLYEAICRSTTYEFAKTAPAFLIITSVWERNFDKYRDFGYPIIMIETGHLGQNLLLMATALGIKTRPLAGFRYDELAAALDIEIINEAPVHFIVLGKS